jgi:hypothetical protein
MFYYIKLDDLVPEDHLLIQNYYSECSLLDTSTV